MWIKTQKDIYINSDRIAAIGTLNGNTVAALTCSEVLETIAEGKDVTGDVVRAIVSGEKYMEVQ